MNENNSVDLNRDIGKVCYDYQAERVNGLWYVEQTGINKVAVLLGGKYSNLTKKQRKVFRNDCMENTFSGTDVKSWWYYLNCA